MSKSREINRLVFTHCDTEEDLGAREIDRLHREQGYLQIRYHAVIKRDGLVEWGRPFAKASSEKAALLFCIVGNEATPEQQETSERLSNSLQHIYPEIAVEGLAI